MDAAKKPTQTLAKKLSSKAAITIPQKREAWKQAIREINEACKLFKNLKISRKELKPELFNEIKNSKKAKDTKAKHDSNTQDGMKNLRKTAKKPAVKAEVQKNDKCPVEPKKLRRITRTNRVKDEVLDPALEVVSEVQKDHTNTEPCDATLSTTLELGDIKLEKCCSKTENKETKKEQNNQQKWEPTNWRLLLDNIRSMRAMDNAPVDTMGCHKCADENADEKTQRYHKLVALMLSSQTKDETTYHAMLRLREHSLTPETICEMKVNVLENMLHPVSFYKNKAKFLQQTSKILIDNYNSDIPKNIKELVALPGVGPKMAHICMATAWHETTGIGVDVHVHRICNRLQWVPKATKEPEQTRVALESWLPRNLWKEVNHLLVGFGQTTCTPLRPKCSDCLNCTICPSAPKSSTKSKEKVENVKLMNLCDKSKFKKTKMHL